MSGLNPKVVARAQKVLESVSQNWVSMPGVISVEVARRRIAGVPVDEVGIRVTLEDLAFAHDESGNSFFPDSLQGIPVEIATGTRPEIE